ncbi:thiamine diphosphokinase [Paenibacillus sp. N4]|uniref:thiamine diphosphokinase n=1 Tax=Paenibacillus vietnamensis TaxID=2590547 RepID=UPI001CD0C914|nr:thiamine diphosphokinase [Paenibacillus vietnamensis]MCA0757974.1 thiamine diphosphokinase [Paenibacillus vietnamensis]
MQPRVIICSGGKLGAWAIEHIQEGDLLIGADSGARFLVGHGFRPDIAIGDFDSVSVEELNLIRESSGQVIACDPVDKDYTDTEMAFRLALDLKPSEILLLGALGTRFDHSLANVHLLALAGEQDIDASIIDEHNKISLLRRRSGIRKLNYPNVSLLPLSKTVTGITLTGFRYPLHESTLSIGQSLGISNILLEDSGTIDLREGLLLVIQSRD